MSAVVTVVAWADGDELVHAVGPTASGGASLEETRRAAEARWGHACVVPWALRCVTPAEVLAWGADTTRADHWTSEADELLARDMGRGGS